MTPTFLRLNDGTFISVPSSLNAITTYVLLEQEQWFEKETHFLARWLASGMNVIDIGANLGIYSLSAARKVGPSGRVFAYEPASDTRRHLNNSKKKNHSVNLEIIGAALSDGEREGTLSFGTSSELNALGDGPGESVRISSLDAEAKTLGWGKIDFIKIDAEGEEERIIAGGKAFFKEQSPLVMLEVKAGDKHNDTVRDTIVGQGYAVYRLLGDASVLVPVAKDETLDTYELNLFAAKADRATSLANMGLLLGEIPSWAPDDEARAAAVPLIKAQRFASTFMQVLNAPLHPEYLDGLAGYAAWHAKALPLAQRVGALKFACDTLEALCAKDGTLARLSTLARAAFEFGRRSIAVAALQTIEKMLKQGSGRMEEPFWPARSSFDAVLPEPHVMEWFVVGSLEQLEKLATHSSMFGSAGIDLDWLCAQPFASSEMQRRRVLRHALAGHTVDVPRQLMTSSADHINSDKWRTGFVPNTVVKR